MSENMEAQDTKERILMVDDNPTNLQVLFQTLNGLGFELRVAKNGEDALALAQKTRPDLILLDVMMPPGIDGYEVCKRLKADPATSDAKIIFLTALGETKNKVQGLELGAVDFITKPFQAEEVIARVHTHLSIRRLEKNLIKEKEVAETAKKTMNNFLNGMSHELRTPLNGILGFADLLKRELFGPLNEKQKTYVEHIGSSGKHLLSLINDVLDIAKIDSGQAQLDLETLDINELIDGTLNMTKTQFMEKGIEVKTFVDSSLSTIEGDRRKCKQVFLNLLSNAIKYTPEKGKVGIRAENHKTFVKFLITDTGIGIKSEDQAIIFDEFQQADRVRDEAMGGTGLGLSLTRRLVQMHDGEIDVESEEGKGSTFWFTLPFKEPDKVKKEAGQSAADSEVSPKRTGHRVLVAEDNKINLAMILALLQVRDHQVFIAKNGQEAVDLAQTQKPDIILMDMNMPVMNGFDATRSIRKIPGFSEIPIIAVTASVDKDNKEKCLQAGCTDLLPKPLESKELFETLDRYL